MVAPITGTLKKKIITDITVGFALGGVLSAYWWYGYVFSVYCWYLVCMT